MKTALNIAYVRGSRGGGGGSSKPITSKDGSIIVEETATEVDLAVNKELINYNSAMPDDMATPFAIGGIAKGTTAEQLKGKSLSQIIDDLLFPTIQPTLTNPSASLKLAAHITQANMQVGTGSATYPCIALGTQLYVKDVMLGDIVVGKSSFTETFSQGSAVAGSVRSVLVGEKVNSLYSISVQSTSANSFSENVDVPLNTSFKLFDRINYSQGPELKDSKGGKATASPNPRPAGYIDCNITVCVGVPLKGNYEIYNPNTSWQSSASATMTTKTTAYNQGLPLGGLADANLKTISRTFGFAAEAIGGKWEIIFPNNYNVSKVEIYNALSGKFEAFSSYVVADAETQTYSGVSIAAKRFATAEGTAFGWSIIRITFNR